MSFQTQSGDLSPFTEVVPGAASFGKPEKSSILTSRRRCRVVPQGGPTASAGSQIAFLIADQGGLLDMSSAVLNYTATVAGSDGAVLDDGHPFMTLQIALNGQLVENIQNAPKVANVEMTMGGSKSYYQTAGSFQGFELLNDDLDAALPSAWAATTVNGWGAVTNNLVDLNVRLARAGSAVYNGITGEQRSIPLGLMCGLGRMKQYLPISIIGELAMTLIVGQNSEILFANSASTGDTVSFSNISLEYDVVVPDARYMAVLQKVAMEDGGLVLPYESSVVATGGAIALSSTMTESSIIVSRATNNLLRASVVQIPSAMVAARNHPSQSCFSHAGLYSVQFRVGSQVYPQIAAQGDASLFNMSLCAYGSASLENGTITNRALWGSSTNGATAGTPAVYETAQVATGGATKFAFADRCVPSYGFQTIKGKADQLAVDGVSLAGASGSQLVVSLVSAPGVAYTPFVITTATRFIKAAGGSISVVGA